MRKMENEVTTARFCRTLCVLLALGMSCTLFGCGSNKLADHESLMTESTALEETVAMEPAVTEVVILMPWDEDGAKQPADYTWEEFEALTGVQQTAFKAHLGVDAYGKWLDNMREYAQINPWDEPGAKQPEEYSLEEYEQLTAGQQVAFQNVLGAEEFNIWFTQAQNQSVKNPWEEPDAKQPAEYTMKEYEELTAGQQMAFQDALGAEGFENWLNETQDPSVQNPWEKTGAKQPEEYTIKEFERLTAGQQMAFQDALGAEGFENWLNREQDQSAINPWERTGAKQPAEYTMREFERLTAGQQIAFQNVLGAEGFENWLNKAQQQTEKNPWERPGAKQPAEYTMREFEKLTAGQQMAFQDALGPDAFGEWLEKASGQEENP